MIRSHLASLFQVAVDALRPADVSLPPVEIQEPRDPSHGDFACNFALMASKTLGQPPRQIAEALVAALPANEWIASTDIAGPGFINIRLKPEAVAAQVRAILALQAEGLAKAAGAATETSRSQPQRINLEFVSVNPNGPITVGSGRGAAFGSTLANVLEAAGHSVHREYYINDGVNSEQMRLFAESVRAYVTGIGDPQYKGDYVQQVAKRFLVHGRIELNGVQGTISVNLVDSPPKERAERIQRYKLALLKWPSLANEIEAKAEAKRQAQSLDAEIIQQCVQSLMVASQKSDLATFCVHFDTWFSEQRLHDSGAVQRATQDLEAKGAADREPIRHKLKLGKGGVIEDVEIEPQTGAVNEEGDADGEPQAQPAPHAGPLAGETLWLRSTKFGDDMDRVLRRGDGRLTYIASDVAYHKDKFNRGSKPDASGRVERADKLITVLGPDHHGYIGRLHAVVGALLEAEPASDAALERSLSELESKLYVSPAERDACRAALAESKEKLEVVIFQIVRFVKDGKPAPMRKRDGNIYSLRDLMSEIGKTAAPNEPEDVQLSIGKDVARFFYLMRSHDTHMDFDIDLATKQSDENPVFYCQYAYARICSVLLKAKDAGFEASEQAAENLTHERELELIKKICDLPYEVRRCAEDYGVHRLTTYAQELARSYHHFYDACRILQPDQPELTRARLALCKACQVGLAAVFQLLGVTPRERMDRVEPEAAS